MAEAEAGSGRAIASESYKEELYQTIEVLVRDRNFKFLCNIEGIYRDDLVALVKTALRPISTKEANDYVSHWIQIGLFNIVLKDTEFLMPKELLESWWKGKGKKKKKSQFPKGYVILGELENNMLLVRTFKQFLVPAQELRAVCSVLEPYRH